MMHQDLTTLRNTAEALFEAEKFTDLVALLPDDILEQYNDATLFAWRARAHYRLRGDADQTMLYAKKAVDLDGNYFMGYFARACAWDDKGEYDKAIEDYTKAIDLNPDDAVAYNNRGVSWDNKGQYDQAIDDYNKAIDLKPDYADAYINRGLSWSSKGLYVQAIVDYTKAIDLKPDYADAYYNRGNSWYNKGQYDQAIEDYNKAINLNPEDAVAYNNRGNSWHNNGQYDQAIEDYNKAIDLKPDYADAYYNRGNSWLNKSHYDQAIEDYNKAIELKPDYADAYNNRGNARRLSGKDLKSSITDFEKYLELTPKKSSSLAALARNFIQELREKIKDTPISEIEKLTTEIKNLLLVKDGCITHYTGLSVAKILIMEEKSQFRLSEGAFLNDTSEGTELFKFLEYEFYTKKDGLIAETFAPKPFIGSFVAEEKHDDLNLWRFYGKEEGVEAKGCAITLRMKDLLEAINNSIMDGSMEKSNIRSDNDINFYSVAYWDHNQEKTNFHIPNAKPGVEERLNDLMDKLKDKVEKYENEDKSVLEKYLNTIAYLFKSDAYKNENEIRLVIKGIEFEKKFVQDANPPRVYIELVNIRSLIKQITLGPKVDKPDEWASAFYYSYDLFTDKRPEKIFISRLPYK